MIKRSAAVVLAVTFQKLVDGRTAQLTEDQLLCIEALRRSTTALRTASNEEMGDYIGSLSPEQLRGVVSNVKGIFHEMLVQRAFEQEGVDVVLPEATNHPGSDLEFLVDGTVIHQVQLKAVQSPTTIIEHFSRYPEIDVMASNEVALEIGQHFGDRVTPSGFDNTDLERMTQDSLSALEVEGLAEFVVDGALTSTLLAGALQSRALLSGARVDPANLRSALESAGVGIATAVVLEALLGAI